MKKNINGWNFFSKNSDLSKISIADIISSASGAAFWLFFASILTSESYGQIIFLISIAGLASTLSMVGTSNSLIVLTSKKIPIESTINFVSIILAVIISIFIIIFYQKIEIAILTYSYIFTNLAICQFLGKKEINNYFMFSILNKGLIISSGILFYYIFDDIGIIFGLSMSVLIFGKKIYSDFKNIKINFQLYKSNFRFIISNSVIDISNSISGSMDKIIIVPLLGFSVLAGYQIGLQFCTVLVIIPNIVYKITLSDDARGISNQKLKVFSIIIVIILTTVGIIVAPYVVPIFNSEYNTFILEIQILLSSAIPITVNTMLSSNFIGNQRNKILIINSLIHSSVLISSIFILGTIYGGLGICVGYVISQSIVCIFNIFVKLRRYDEK